MNGAIALFRLRLTFFELGATSGTPIRIEVRARDVRGNLSPIATLTAELP